MVSLVVYALLGWSLLIVIVGGIGAVGHWVLDTSVFHQMASSPAVSPHWEANGVMTAIGCAGALIGGAAFRRTGPPGRVTPEPKDHGAVTVHPYDGAVAFEDLNGSGANPRSGTEAFCRGGLRAGDDPPHRSISECLPWPIATPLRLQGGVAQCVR